MDAKDLFKRRRSSRRFKAQPVAENDIEEIILAASLAPTARNIQPWEFVVVKDPQTLSRLAAIASQNAPFLSQAPVCIAVFCQETKYYLEDGAAATTQALLCAAAYGYGACWVAGDKKDYAAEVSLLLGAPQGYRLVSLIALGVPDDDLAPQKRPLETMIHRERF